MKDWTNILSGLQRNLKAGLIILILASGSLFADDRKDPSLTDPFQEPKDPEKGALVENRFILSNDDPQEIFMNVTYEKLFNITVSTYYFNDKIYVPAIEIMNALKINASVLNGGSKIDGNFITNDQSYSIDFKSKTARIGEKHLSFTENDFIVKNGMYYVLPQVLENIFGFHLNLDFNYLVLKITCEEMLPVMMMHERELGRQDLQKNKSEVKAPLVYNRDRSWVNAGFLDYSFSASFSEYTTPNYFYELNLGTELIGGDLRTTLRGKLTKDEVLNFHDKFDPHFLWKYSFKENWLINQLSVGEMVNDGFYSGNVTGVKFTNTPAEPRTTFDKYTITDRTIPNSDVELYINNNLYDYKKADALGNVFFEVPITFGSNYIYLKIFSPTGEVIESERKIQVPSGFLPQGSFDYNASYGITKETHEKIYSANLSAGITNWLTNKVGFEKIDNNDYNKAIFFNSVSARLFSQYIVNVTTAPDLYNRVNLNASFPSQASFEVAYTKYKENLLYNKFKMDEEYSVRGILPYEIANNQFITQTSVKNLKFENQSEITRYDVDQSMNFQNFRTSVSYSHTENKFQGISNKMDKLSMGTYYSIPEMPFFLSFMKSNLLNAKVDYNITNKVFESFQTILTTSVTEGIRLQLGYRTNFTPGSSSYSAQFVFDLPFTRNYITMNTGSVSTTVQGSVGMDVGYDKWLFYNRPQVGSSAVSFRMFYDENSNGKYDDGEEILDDVKLNLKQVATFDRSNNQILRVTELVPNHEYTAVINEASLKNPLMVPKYKKFSFIPSPNVYKKIDIPFYQSEEVMGSITVKRGNEEIKMGGIEVLVKNLQTNELITISSYFDGELYYLGLVPGKYIAYVKPELLRNLGAKSLQGEIKFTIHNGNQNKPVEELHFVIELPED